MLYDYLLPYYKEGLDGAIVQDLGVLAFLRRTFPGLPLHASTQMTVTGIAGARQLKELGAKRVVLARELSLEEIKEISRQADIEVECFVHGALCYAYSGQCLFSSLIGGRSGNRGRCAQTCRLPYEVKGEDGRPMTAAGERYCLSLKDLCTLDLLPELLEAGVFSLKIEGRMKSPRYTAGVVNIYRKYADRYLEFGKKGYKVEDKDRKLLLDLFDRGGQTEGYYKRQNGRDMVVWKEKPEFREGNQTLFDYLDKTFVQKPVLIPVKGTVFLKEGERLGFALESGGHRVFVQGENVESARNQSLTEETVKKQFGKTGNTAFFFETLKIEMQGKGFLPVQALNDLRRRGLEALEQAVVRVFLRGEGDWTSGGEHGRMPEKKEGQHGSKEYSFNPSFKLTALLENSQTFVPIVTSPDIARIYLDAAAFAPASWKSCVAQCHEKGKECMLALPYIFRKKAKGFFDSCRKELIMAGFDGFLLRSLEETGYLREAGVKGTWVFDYNLYGMNTLAQEELLSLGAGELTWPVELNSRELEKLKVKGELLAYGRIPVMTTAQCLVKERTKGERCGESSRRLSLTDRKGKIFPVKNHCAFCYNSIYNSAPLSLLGMGEAVRELSPVSLRLSFTTEDGEEAKEVVRRFADEFLLEKKGLPPVGEFTRGHFKRGVE